MGIMQTCFVDVQYVCVLVLMFAEILWLDQSVWIPLRSQGQCSLLWHSCHCFGYLIISSLPFWSIRLQAAAPSKSSKDWTGQKDLIWQHLIHTSIFVMPLNWNPGIFCTVTNRCKVSYQLFVTQGRDQTFCSMLRYMHMQVIMHKFVYMTHHRTRCQVSCWPVIDEIHDVMLTENIYFSYFK